MKGLVCFSKGEGMNFGVVEVVRCSTLRWFSPLERMEKNEVMRSISVSKIEEDPLLNM